MLRGLNRVGAERRTGSSIVLRWLRAIVALFLSTEAFAEWEGRCDISFKGTSTLHDFSGIAHSLPFIIDEQTDASGHVTWTLAVEVPVAEMDTQHDGRDRKMRAALDAEHYPKITGRADELDEAVLHRETVATNTLPFTLSLKGRDHKIEAAVTGWKTAEKQTEFDMDFPLSLNALDVRIPSVLGVIRVGDRVDVRVHVVLARPAAGA